MLFYQQLYEISKYIQFLKSIFPGMPSIREKAYQLLYRGLVTSKTGILNTDINWFLRHSPQSWPFRGSKEFKRSRILHEETNEAYLNVRGCFISYTQCSSSSLFLQYLLIKIVAGSSSSNISLYKVQFRQY